MGTCMLTHIYADCTCVHLSSLADLPYTKAGSSQVFIGPSSRVEVLNFCFDFLDKKLICFNPLNYTLVCFDFLGQTFFSFSTYSTQKKCSPLVDPIQICFDVLDKNQACFECGRPTFRLSRSKLKIGYLPTLCST